MRTHEETQAEASSIHYQVENPSSLGNTVTSETPGRLSSRNNRPSNDQMLSLANLNLACNEWFASYHAWFPILHQPSYLEALQTNPFVLKELPNLLIFKAIAAVVYQSRHSSNPLGNGEDVQAWSSVLRRKIIKKAMSKMSLESLQALLILSVMDFGAGNFYDFWNVVALCKR